jgi:uncharacterized membrane protein
MVVTSPVEVAMESRVKLLGHPVHPMLIVLPLGLLATATVFDVLYVATGNPDLSTFSFWALVAGVVGGLGAATFGLIDWLAIPRGTRARRIGAMHGVGNVVVVGIFVVSLLLRVGGSAYLPSVAPMILAVLGAALALVTAWLGGELVFRLGVGVDNDAGLDAPSSIERGDVVDIRAR